MGESQDLPAALWRAPWEITSQIHRELVRARTCPEDVQTHRTAAHGGYTRCFLTPRYRLCFVRWQWGTHPFKTGFRSRETERSCRSSQSRFSDPGSWGEREPLPSRPHSQAPLPAGLHPEPELQHPFGDRRHLLNHFCFSPQQPQPNITKHSH